LEDTVLCGDVTGGVRTTNQTCGLWKKNDVMGQGVNLVHG